MYLDDIIIFSNSLETHIEKLKGVFDRITEYNLKLEPQKCHFLLQEIVYLGHLITDKGVQPDPKKIACVENYSVPKDPKEIKSFLGFLGFLNFHNRLQNCCVKTKSLIGLVFNNSRSND